MRQSMDSDIFHFYNEALAHSISTVTGSQDECSALLITGTHQCGDECSAIKIL